MFKKSLQTLFKINPFPKVALLKYYSVYPSFYFAKTWKPQKYTGGGGLTKSGMQRCSF